MGELGEGEARVDGRRTGELLLLPLGDVCPSDGLLFHSALPPCSLFSPSESDDAVCDGGAEADAGGRTDGRTAAATQMKKHMKD